MDDWCRIVGTSHIASQAVREVRKSYAERSPDVVAVELDHGRLTGLLSKEKPKLSWRLAREIGVRGYLFALIGSSLQRRLGRVVGVSPGSDMLAAVRLARRDAKTILLIDRDLRITLNRLNRAMGWHEFKQFVRDLFRSLLGREKMKFNLSAVPSEEVVDELIAELRRRYPRPYAVLVHERNVHMARLLLAYHAEHPHKRILVVVGAGHVAGIRQLLASAQQSQTTPS